MTDVRGFYADIGIALPDVDGTNFKVRCFSNPGGHAHGDRSPSCSVNAQNGTWYCHGCADCGGAYDAAVAKGRDPSEAMALLRRHDFTVTDSEAWDTGRNGYADGSSNGAASRTDAERLAAALEPAAELPTMTVVSAEDFAAEDEAGAEPIVGDVDDVLIPIGGDVMIRGDGGAGKTTLSIDLCCHMATPRDWLGFRIGRAVRVLMVENEGPRPLMRRKVARKLRSWSDLGSRFSIAEAPWAQFTFATAEWRTTLAQAIKEREIDVLVVGPLVRIGMDSAGTLQEVIAFMQFIADVRAQCGRPLTVILVHHENKAERCPAPGRVRETRCSTSKRAATASPTCTCRRRAGPSPRTTGRCTSCGPMMRGSRSRTSATC
jgi:hypothetical protein